MTNDLHEVLNANPGSINAYTEILKAVFLFLQSLGPVMGAIVGGGVPAIGLLATWLIKRNTSVTSENTTVTKANTKATASTSKTIESQITELKLIQKEILASFESLKQTTEETKTTLKEETNKFKIGVMRAKDEVDKNLSGIASVQKALEARVAIAEKNVTVIVEGLKKFKEGKQ